METNFRLGMLFGIILASMCCGSESITPTPINPPPSQIDLSACYLPAETGPCRALFPRYYFDLVTGQCNLFTYGGCQGNANNFVTRKECQAFGVRCLRNYKGSAGNGRPHRYGIPVGSSGRFPGSGWKS